MTTKGGATTEVGDALAARARDFASGGLVVFPVLAHLVSVALLMRLRLAGLPVGYKGRKAAREAWRLNFLVLGVAAVCIALAIAVSFGLPSWRSSARSWT